MSPVGDRRLAANEFVDLCAISFDYYFLRWIGKPLKVEAERAYLDANP
jgi:hypothetical protein